MADKPQTREERRNQSSKRQPREKKSAKGLFKKIFLGLVIFGIFGLLAGAATFAFMVQDTPKLDESMLKDPISSKIYDMNGELVREVGSEHRDYIAFEDIPQVVKDAIIATEDVRFYKHNGVDPIRLGGAVLANITDGFGAEGASTITQQVVKNYFLSFDKTLDRKAKEVWLAFQLEQKYTKDEIFEMYANKIFMSENSHGLATAAKIYFGKPLQEVELHEAALLAGIPQSPNNYNPFNYPEKAENRRNTVLSLMHQHGFISEQEMKEAQAIPVTSTLVAEEDREKRKEKEYDAFVDRVIDEVEQQGDFDIFSDGLEIYTTLDPKAQSYVENALNTNDVVNYPNDEIQAGVALLDTQTGEIRAIGGGRNQEGEREWNYATDLKRQTGSTIKPILDYGPAIEHLNWGTYHMLEDKPYQYSNGQPINNWNNRYEGPMTMRTALAKSRNIPALQALQAAGLDKARDFAEGLGLGDFLPDPITESAALGSYEMSPLKMAGAYAAFGNNGFYTEPYAVKKIVLRDKTEIDMTPESVVAMKDYTAFMITDMLKSAVSSSYGTGGMANIPNLPVAGKTGTTNYDSEQMSKWNIPDGAVPDSWFVGYTSRYTAAVWTGYETKENALLADGYQQKIPQILFKNIIQEVSRNIETPDFPTPNSVVRVAIERGTIPAKLASEYTPKDQIPYEYAVKGNVPAETSKKFEKLDAPNKLNAKYDETTNEIILAWGHKAKEGVSFEVRASLDAGPEQLLKSASGTGLKIANPSPGGTYTFKVTAIRGNQRSDPASTSIQIPAPSAVPDEAEPDEAEKNIEKEKEQEKEKEKEQDINKENPNETGNNQDGQDGTDEAETDTPVNENDNGNGTGNTTGNNGSETGNNGSETGNNGSETGNNGSEAGNNGSEAGNNGSGNGSTP